MNFKRHNVSVIIVNYKVKNELFKCLKSICSSKQKIGFEIIVVDNDEIKEIDKELIKRFPKVKYIKTNKNLGFGGGNNLGATITKGEYLFFLNPDTLVLDDVIERLYKFIKSDKNIGIVSPLLVNNQLTPFSTQSRKELTPLNAIYSFSFLRKFFPKKSIYNDDFFKYWDKKLPIEVDTVPGAALMISKKLFDKVNGFDERFFLYFEENDLSKRIINLGYKLYIYPKSKIIHEVGQSTKNVSNMEKIYSKSRYVYLKKHYGILKALFVESFLRINKVFFLILVTLLLALFLRIYNLSQSMVFIGDQGWFYLSARDLLVDGKIPLVGITSSHTWLHQGPLWTYMLSAALFLGNFNPIYGGFLTAIFGAGSAFLMYSLGSEIFSKKIGIIASLLYSVSPLIVFFDRMPFDPSLIPFFTILYFYCIYKWVTGKIQYFPFVLFFIAILYNLELATFTLFFPFIVLFIYGLIKKKQFIIDVFTKDNLVKSVFAFIFPMIPVIIYDFSHGFKQTIVFLVWVAYKPFSFLFKTDSSNFLGNLGNVVNFLLQNLQRIIFDYNQMFSLVIFLLSLSFLSLSVYREKGKIFSSKFLLLIFLIISVLGILINQTPSDAYLPIIFPFVIFTVAVFWGYLLTIKKIKFLILLILLILVSNNFYSSYKNSLRPDFENRIKAVERIIVLSKGQEYNLIGEGNGSQFISFTMNYEYLLWWMQNPPSKKDQGLKIYVSEDKHGINIR